MKKILTTVWNISALWAILTCVYCGLDGKISTDTKIMLWNNWYIPLLSRYWDWAFCGLCILLIALIVNCHWLPRSSNMKKDDGKIWWVPVASLIFYFTFLSIAFSWNHKDRAIFPNDETAKIFFFWIAMILSYTGWSREFWTIVAALSFVMITISHNAHLAFLMLSSTMIIKVVFWLVINIMKSGYKKAFNEWWGNMKDGPDTVIL